MLLPFHLRHNIPKESYNNIFSIGVDCMIKAVRKLQVIYMFYHSDKNVLSDWFENDKI